MSPIPFGLGNVNNTNCGQVGGTGRGNFARSYDAGNNWWGQGIANTVFILRQIAISRNARVLEHMDQLA